MGLTQQLNNKAIVKKSTTNDLPYSPLQPVISSYYGTSTASQTVINLSYSVDQTLTDQFFLFVDGKKLALGSSNDYTFTSVDQNNQSAQITLNQALVSGLNIQAYKLGLKKESEFLTDTRFTNLYAFNNVLTQSFVSQTDNIINATQTGGTPTAGLFYSAISGRSSMPDISQDLKPRFGVDRIPIQGISLMANEFGANGEPVFGVVGDQFNQIRLVGGGWTSSFGANGSVISTTSTTDYIEVVFYGTGISLLANLVTAAYNFSYALNGGSSNSVYSVTANGTIQTAYTRAYNMNQVIPLMVSAPIGINTVKITQSGAGGMSIYGVEVLNQLSTTSLTVNPGISYVSSKKTSTTSQFSAAYSAPVTGTRGGRVLVYQSGAGVVGTAFTAAASSASAFSYAGTGYTGSAASHTNEEIAKRYSWREFGTGTTTDFAYYSLSSSPAYFTLEDGTTSLFGSSVTANTASNTVYASASAAFINFTFVGTGVDIVEVDTATTIDSHSFLIDGTTVGTTTTGYTELTRRQIVSGLPYGTHTLQILRNAATTPLQIHEFIVYQPLTPTLPAGAVQLGTYNVLANYVANATAGNLNIAQGVLRKTCLRENVLTGTGWQAGTATTSYSQYALLQTVTTGDAFKFAFFGTGFEFRWPLLNNNATTVTVSVDGATNFTASNSSPTAGAGWSGALTTSVYGTGSSFTASTGVLNENGSSNSFFDGGLSISGMTLGVHTVTITWTSGGSSMRVNWFDVITPIHSLKISSNNALQIGSQGIRDDRAIAPIRSLAYQKVRARVIGNVTSASLSTTVGVYVPMPEMSITVNLQNAGYVQAAFSGQLHVSASTQCSIVFFVDGIQYGIGTSNDEGGSNSSDNSFSLTDIIPLSAGTHVIAVYWSGSSQWVSTTNYRTFNVVEL